MSDVLSGIAALTVYAALWLAPLVFAPAAYVIGGERKGPWLAAAALLAYVLAIYLFEALAPGAARWIMLR